MLKKYTYTITEKYLHQITLDEAFEFLAQCALNNIIKSGKLKNEFQ